MTKEQFQTLTKLMRGKPESAANRSAARVLVDGETQADAARAESALPQTVTVAVRRYRDADAAVRAAYCANLP